MAMRQAKHISATEAAALVKSGDWIDYGVTIGQPDAFDAALAARKDELTGVNFRSCISVKPRAVLEADPLGDHFTWFSWHYSGYDRKKADAGIAHYMPINLGEIPDYYRRFLPPIDVACIKVCPKDENGNYTFGGTGLWHPAVMECARTRIVEVCEHLPRTFNEGCKIHESEVDFVIAGDGSRPAELPDTELTDVDRQVGRLIAEEIEDGACIQVGIGGMPNAACAALLESGAKDLGLHSEMLTDSMVDLVLSGQATGARKTLDQGRHVYSFALGQRKLYDAINDNPDFCCYPADYTNLPHNIMRNEKVVAINNTTQIDLTGQAASESDGLRHISGTGGQLQFVRGAYASPGGKSFICMSSTFEKGNVRKSRIVLSLTLGNTVTTPRTDMMYVVTEYGCVNLKGQTVADRARLLISVAHPDYREALEREARDAGLVPKGYW
ncbi:MAG: acetyl-CoA hydrolase/transferase C-terminal domain-containing protein [Paracoccaceae bacterium]|nr:acetyl-CoA hydrolase/transferase C-terminal domain-containing protein [Paracoccaceae bacterium]